MYGFKFVTNKYTVPTNHKLKTIHDEAKTLDTNRLNILHKALSRKLEFYLDLIFQYYVSLLNPTGPNRLEQLFVNGIILFYVIFICTKIMRVVCDYDL